MSELPPLAGDVIERDADTRLSQEKLLAAWKEPTARVLILRGPEVLVQKTEECAQAAATQITAGLWEGKAAGATAQNAHELSLLTPAELTQLANELPQDLASGTAFVLTDAGPHYLGRVAGQPLFAYALPARTENPAGTEWANPMGVAASLPEEQLPLLGVANALLRWHEQGRFSSLSGIPTTPDWGGWRRVDEAGVEHFPRTDPAVIVLIEHEGKVLLGSNVLWEAGRYSLLAGFVEAGESLEQACIREVREEAGIEITKLRYMASQPWPFPRSLMLGFRAALADTQSPTDLNPDPAEIAELRWFTPEEILHPGPGIILPGKLSIARWMLDQWATEQLDAAGAAGA